MKDKTKITVMAGVLFVVCLGMGKGVSAASVGLPADQKGLSASLEYTHVFNQDLEDQTSVKNLEIDKSDAILRRDSHHRFSRAQILGNGIFCFNDTL